MSVTGTFRALAISSSVFRFGEDLPVSMRAIVTRETPETLESRSCEKPLIFRNRASLKMVLTPLLNCCNMFTNTDIVARTYHKVNGFVPKSLFHFCIKNDTKEDGGDFLAMDIGKRIAELRRERGLNQEQLAELALLSRVTIAKYESGRVEPGAQALSRIADALEVTTDTILGRSEEAQEIPEQPSTSEARAVSFGMDKLPKEQREMILNMVCAMFPNTFEKGEDK